VCLVVPLLAQPAEEPQQPPAPERVCQQANGAPTLLVGSNESVDRNSPIVP